MKMKKDWPREAYPLGTVRIRQSGKSRVRMIKITHLGPKQKRWMELARHWWLKNKGKIPPGMRVVHANGDTLDDRPENYTLMSAGHIAMLYRRLDPEIDARNRRNASKGTARCNRERALLERSRRIMPSLWYPVDFTQRLIHNEPVKKRWRIYERAGFSCCKSNGQVPMGILLGWRDLTSPEAMILAAICAGASTIAGIFGFVTEMGRKYTVSSPGKMKSLYQYLDSLRKKGIVQARRRGPHSAIYSILALPPKHDVCPIVAVYGARLLTPEFASLRRSDAPQDAIDAGIEREDA